jgi:hypothetical protein
MATPRTTLKLQTRFNVNHTPFKPSSSQTRCEIYNDMDANSPFSLILKWDVRQVIDVKKTPALWKKGLARDVQIIR